MRMRSTFLTLVGLDTSPGCMVSTEVALHVEARRERTVGPRGSSEMSPQMVVEQDPDRGDGGGGKLSGTSNSTLFGCIG